MLYVEDDLIWRADERDEELNCMRGVWPLTGDKRLFGNLRGEVS